MRPYVQTRLIERAVRCRDALFACLVSTHPKTEECAVPAAISGRGGVRLSYSDDAAAGIHRVAADDGFHYIDEAGAPIDDEATIDRIRALAIPPAYTDVWICADPNGHLQATGRDARGRKQYRYHAFWRALRDRDKFGQLHAFGKRLPALRRRLHRDLASSGLNQNKVLALAVSILEATLIRVGNAEYLRENHSYGLTTLRARHADFPHSGVARFRFRGKSGKDHELEIDDGRLVRLLRRCQRLPGQPLFQFVDDEGQSHPIDSGMLNDYLHEAMGSEFTAKDFRTWGATLLAAQLLAGTPLPEEASERQIAGLINEIVREVAKVLGNTVAVCRSSYIHPLMFAAWKDNGLASLAGTAKSSRELEKRLLAVLMPRKPRRSKPRASARDEARADASAAPPA